MMSIRSDPNIIAHIKSSANISALRFNADYINNITVIFANLIYLFAIFIAIMLCLTIRAYHQAPVSENDATKYGACDFYSIIGTIGEKAFSNCCFLFCAKKTNKLTSTN